MMARRAWVVKNATIDSNLFLNLVQDAEAQLTKITNVYANCACKCLFSFVYLFVSTVIRLIWRPNKRFDAQTENIENGKITDISINKKCRVLPCKTHVWRLINLQFNQMGNAKATAAEY